MQCFTRNIQSEAKFYDRRDGHNDCHHYRELRGHEPEASNIEIPIAHESPPRSLSQTERRWWIRTSLSLTGKQGKRRQCPAEGLHGSQDELTRPGDYARAMRHAFRSAGNHGNG
jgi:hypothetical protein